jgi:hypothetical protein
MHLYIKIGKEKEEKEKGFWIAGPGGGFSAQPSVGERRCGRMGSGGPRRGGMARANAVGVGPLAREGGLTASVV